jgi:predicted aldo/keto reductase-like oxidoreductase
MSTAVERNYGILAMKTLADGRFFPSKKVLDENIWETDRPILPDQFSLSDALNFVWSLPVSVLITGAENKELVNEKIRMAKNFNNLSENQRKKLIDRVADFSKEGKVEYYKEV